MLLLALVGWVQELRTGWQNLVKMLGEMKSLSDWSNLDLGMTRVRATIIHESFAIRITHPNM
jgi:hypothetical protein